MEGRHGLFSGKLDNMAGFFHESAVVLQDFFYDDFGNLLTISRPFF